MTTSLRDCLCQRALALYGKCLSAVECVYVRERESDCASISLNLRFLPVGVYANSNSVQDESSYSAPGETSVNELIGDLMP